MYFIEKKSSFFIVVIVIVMNWIHLYIEKIPEEIRIRT